jgi:uncharacterized protein (TIGR04255 family)
MMTTRPENLPDFAHPPVVETVLSVQFDPLVGFRAVHLGLLWSKYRAEYPRTEERPPLDPFTEQFPEVAEARLGLRIEAYENLPLPRAWFLNGAGNALIQIQPDRFTTNWRKEQGGGDYPRYEWVKASFERNFVIFEEFLRENGLGRPHINQCEVTYMNHVVAGEGWSSFGEADRVFRFWKVLTDPIPGPPEDLRLHIRYPIPSPSGEFAGRLHVDVQPGFRTADRRPMYAFQLTARGQSAEASEFFDLGREWIVKAFAALTTPQMHRVWGRKDNHGSR